MTKVKAIRHLVQAALLVLVGVQPALAKGLTVGDCSCYNKKCPKYVHCQPKPPWLKFHKVCATKTLCDPCTLEQFGYHPTCWSPWPGMPNYSHCQTPVPGNYFPPHAGHAPPYHTEHIPPVHP